MKTDLCPAQFCVTGNGSRAAVKKSFSQKTSRAALEVKSSTETSRAAAC